jgi:hypothetical protein
VQKGNKTEGQGGRQLRVRDGAMSRGICRDITKRIVGPFSIFSLEEDSNTNILAQRVEGGDES